MEKRVFAGFLLTASFVLAFVQFIQWVFIDEVITTVPGTESLSIIHTLFLMLFGFYMCIASMALVAAYSALMKKSWSLAMIGSVCALVSGGPFMTGTILAIVAVTLIGLSRDEFRQEPGPVPERDPYGHLISSREAPHYSSQLNGWQSR
jgi:hypothetical protein